MRHRSEAEERAHGGCERFPPGKSVGRPHPGDFILVSGSSWRAWVISAYELLRARTRTARQSARWNHAALIVGTNGAIVEAGSAGVVLQHLEKYRDVDYHYVTVDATPEERRQAIHFARSRVGSRYSLRALADLVVCPLTRGRLRLGGPHCELCGSLVANALARAGERFDRPPADMLPSDLATHYGLIAGWSSSRSAARSETGATGLDPRPVWRDRRRSNLTTLLAVGVRSCSATSPATADFARMRRVSNRWRR